jgi:hypothetical protein
VLQIPLYSSSIAGENGLNMYSNPMVHGSISTEDKNSTSEGCGEGCEIIVSRTSKTQAVTKKKASEEGGRNYTFKLRKIESWPQDGYLNSSYRNALISQ